MTDRTFLSPKRLPLVLLLAAGCLGAPLPVAFAAQPAAAVTQGAETWTINMKDADIRDFIDQVAEISGETFVVDPRVKGQVTVISKHPLGLEEVYQLFLSVMSTHGFSVLAQGDQARIVPVTEARSAANSSNSAPDDVQTELIQVQHTSVNELIPLIRPLVPQNGHLAAVAASNALIISDRRANIERIRQLINDLDAQGGGDYNVINLQHAWVLDAAEALNSAVMRNERKDGAGTRVIALSAAMRYEHEIDSIEDLLQYGNSTRLEVLGTQAGVTVYDDFAHHPTAIRTTVDGLRRRLDAENRESERILAIFEPRSNTMKLGTMKSQLPWSLENADLAFCHSGGLDWDATAALGEMGVRAQVASDIATLARQVIAAVRPGDHLLCMSNGSFGGIHALLMQQLGDRSA